MNSKTKKILGFVAITISALTLFAVIGAIFITTKTGKPDDLKPLLPILAITLGASLLILLTGIILLFSSRSSTVEISQKLANRNCPDCGKPMEHGYINGHWFQFRWTKDPNTVWATSGEPMSKMDVLHRPLLEAMRCTECQIGIFAYDKDSKTVKEKE